MTQVEKKRMTPMAPYLITTKLARLAESSFLNSLYSLKFKAFKPNHESDPNG